MDLERELRQALSPKSPSAGFDKKVLERIASGETVESPVASPRWPGYVLPLAASLAIVAGGGYFTWEQRERRQTEQTARNVVLALQIASEKVSAVQTRVQEISRYERQIQ